MAEKYTREQLAKDLETAFGDAEKQRFDTEQRWLEDKRQEAGVYDPEVLEVLQKTKGRSRANFKISRAKVRSADAKICDMVFPQNGSLNWTIDPTPIPKLQPDQMQVLRSLAREVSARAGQPQPDEAQLQPLVEDVATAACVAMKRTINDQLTQAGYRKAMRKVIHSGNLYGTGVLKGPLVETSQETAWVLGEDAPRKVSVDVLSPMVEAVRVWDVYPDMVAGEVSECRAIYQRHVMLAADFSRLGSQAGFDRAAVRKVRQSYKDGNAEKLKTWESDLYSMANAKGSAKIERKGRYEVLECWTYLDADKARSLGLDVAKDEAEVPCVCWVCAGTVLRLDRWVPLGDSRWPFYFYRYNGSETGIFGEGIVRDMRDPAAIFNASLRAIMDHTVMASGPQLEVNVDLLDSMSLENLEEFYPWKIWFRRGRGSEANVHAVTVTSLPSYVEQFMVLLGMAEQYANTVTSIPGYMEGLDRTQKGAGRTAKGLSMLMGSSQIGYMEQIGQLDDSVTRPFIAACYDWNMRFNPDRGIKGDYHVTATGVSGLVAREVRADQLEQLAMNTANPLDAPFVDRRRLLEKRLEAQDLPRDVIRPGGAAPDGSQGGQGGQGVQGAPGGPPGMDAAGVQQWMHTVEASIQALTQVVERVVSTLEQQPH